MWNKIGSLSEQQQQNDYKKTHRCTSINRWQSYNSDVAIFACLYVSLEIYHSAEISGVSKKFNKRKSKKKTHGKIKQNEIGDEVELWF